MDEVPDALGRTTDVFSLNGLETSRVETTQSRRFNSAIRKSAVLGQKVGSLFCAVSRAAKELLITGWSAPDHPGLLKPMLFGYRPGMDNALAP